MRYQRKEVESLNYLKHPAEGFPKKIYWTHVCGPAIAELQMYDVVFDEKDLKIRKLIK